MRVAFRRRKKKTSRPETLRRDFVLVSFLKYCVFSAVIFPDFSMSARTRVNASEGCRMNARVLPVQELEEGAAPTSSVKRKWAESL